MLRRHDALITFHRKLARNLIAERRGRRPVFRRIPERSETLEFLFSHVLQKLLEIILRLSRETGHEGRADCAARLLADLADGFTGRCFADFASHRKQNAVGNMLKRHFHAADHAFRIRHRSDDRIRHGGGVQIHQTEPIVALELVEPLNELCRCVLFALVATERRGVLRDDDELFRAVVDEVLRLG